MTKIKQVKKRNGNLVDFDPDRILNAVWKAASSVGGKDKERAKYIQSLVVKELESRFSKIIPTVEEVQDIIERVLIHEGHASTAKAYILYRARKDEMRQELDYNKDQNEYDRQMLKMFKYKSKITSLVDYRLIDNYRENLVYLRQLLENKSIPLSDDYLNGNILAKSIYEKKYFLKDLNGALIDKKPEDVFIRIAAFLSAIEPDRSRRLKWAEEFYRIFYDSLFLPGGRVIAGAGDLYRIKTLANCFVSKIDDDNLESIFKAAYEAARTYSYGGGIGIDLSVLRPCGSLVHNASNSSTGAVSFAELYSVTTGLIGQEGRRGALMLSLDAKHPDSIAFLDVKKNPNWVTENIVEQLKNTNEFTEEQLVDIEKRVRENTQVRFANISLKLSDEFMKAVEEQKKYNKTDILVYLKDKSVQNKDFIQDDNLNYAEGIPSKPIAKYKFVDVFSNITQLNKYLEQKYDKMLKKVDLDDIKNRDVFGDFIIPIDDDKYELAIKYAGDFMLYFHGRQTGEIKKLIKVSKIWDKLIEGNYSTAEPGVMFWSTLTKYSPSNYIDYPIVTTNPCGEVPLEDGGSCNLGSINLSRFVIEPYTKNAKIDLEKLAYSVKVGIRALDNVTSWNIYLHPLEKQKKAAKNTRRLGLGVMGIADMLNQLGFGYDSDEGIEIIEKVLSFISNEAYRNSALLAEEKGRAVAYNYEEYSKNSFFKEALTTQTQEFIKQKGLRNIALLSIAPTGTLSNIVIGYKTDDNKNYIGVSGGLEPIFALYYTRRSETLDKKNKNNLFKVFHSTVQAYIDKQGLSKKAETMSEAELMKILPDYFFRTAHVIDSIKRVKIQGICQKYIDHSISSTVNLPEDIEPEIISDIYFKSWKNKLKGITVYREGSRFAILSVDTKENDFNNFKNNTYKIDLGKNIVKTVRGDSVINIKGRLTTPYHAIKQNLVEIKDDMLIVKNKKDLNEIISRGEKDTIHAIKEKERIKEKIKAGRKTFMAPTYSLFDLEIKEAYKTEKQNTIAEEIKSSNMAICPACNNKTLRVEGGCKTCVNPDCGYSACDI